MERQRKVRSLDDRDVAALVEVAASVGWPATAETWRWMLGLGCAFGVEQAGGLDGAALLFPYEAAFGMLAMMMVRPAAQRHGLGKALLDRAIGELPAGARLALYASDAGERLYRPNGFEDAGASTRFEGTLAAATALAAGVRLATTEDVPAIVALDARAQGAARQKLLASLFDRADSVLLRERDGAVVAFGYSVLEDGARRLGPIVAAEDDDAVAIVSALGGGGEPVRMDLEPGEQALHAWATRAGLSVTVVSPRLVHGGRLPGERASIRALAGRPFG